MSDDKPKIVKLNAPLAILKWPKISAPDYGTKDYPKPDGEYSTKLVWDADDPAFLKMQAKLQPYMDAVEQMAQAEFASLKKPQRDKLGAPTRNDIFTPIYDENDNDTGQVEMKVSMKAGGVVKRGPRAGKKWSRKPDLYDALGRKIKGEIDIWGGTEAIVAFSFMEKGYFIPATGAYGLKMQLEAVQVITLRAGGEKDAASYGFSAQESGFDASQYQAPTEGDGDEGPGDDDLNPNHTPSTDPDGASDF